MPSHLKQGTHQLFTFPVVFGVNRGGTDGEESGLCTRRYGFGQHRLTGAWWTKE